MHHHTTRKYQRGFSFIELMVVIGIIGLLSSVVISTVGVERNKAKIVAAKSELNILYDAVSRYRIDNDTYSAVPFETCGGVNNICSTAVWNAGWLAPYLASVPLDPWGNAYEWDGRPEPGYECQQWQSAICSAGPNGVFESFNQPGPLGDDMCFYFPPEC